jgi:hypothetical protein
MGWVICIPMLIVSMITGNNELLVASGLFAIAGAIAVGSHTVK